MSKRPWQDFAHTTSTSFVPGLVSEAAPVSPDALMDMENYRLDERIAACKGTDPIRILLAYAQDELAYDANNNVVALEKNLYRTLPRKRRLNKFGLSYRRDATLWLNKPLADIVVGTAIHLYKTHTWTTVIYDGLRTVEGAFHLYNFATDQDIENGLLALPGQSAHNKGLAVDTMMEDMRGDEVDMGVHFDHLDMPINSRLYDGDEISEAAKRNRLIREAAFLYGAFTQDLLVAPLRSEFWDDRLPENRADLWRVLDSAARCLGITLLTPEDEKLRKENRAAFSAKWEQWSYQDFLNRWQDVFKDREDELEQHFGTKTPPLVEKPEFYHGNFHPIYDRDLVASGKNITA
jgi:D-alanyl-D-alanine dipeptidase